MFPTSSDLPEILQTNTLDRRGAREKEGQRVGALRK